MMFKLRAQTLPAIAGRRTTTAGLRPSLPPSLKLRRSRKLRLAGRSQGESKVLFLSIFFVLLLTLSAKSQEGAPILTHYRESREIENQSWAICQDADMTMLFANRRGILTYDGQEWGYVTMPTTPYTIKYCDKNNRVYAGGDNDYGYLGKDEKGSRYFVSLTDGAQDLGLITRIIMNGPEIWFYGEKTISRHNLDNHLLEKRFTRRDDKRFTGMFITPKNTFINVSTSGLHRIDSDTLFPIVTGYLVADEEILFGLPYDDSRVLLGISNRKLSLFDGIKFYDYNIDDDGYLVNNTLSEGVTVSDTLYAFSTLDGGVVVVNRKDSGIKDVINYRNGLPDDEVFGIGADNNGGLWISHQYGLTRTDLQLPVGNFSIYPGLRGNLSASAWYNGELYAGTSEGVFRLARIVSYVNYEILVRAETRPGSDPGEPSSEMPEVQERSRNRIFSRIFGRRVTPVREDLPGSQPAIQEEETEEQYVRKKVSKVRSISYVYERIEGLNEKCRQLAATEHGILAATNRGLYLINRSQKAVPIVNDRYINFITWMPHKGIYYAAASDGYFTIQNINGKWIPGYPDSDFKSSVYSIILTGNDTLWLGCDNFALRTTIENGKRKGSYTEVKVDEIPDMHVRYRLAMANDTVLLFTAGGIFFYDITTDKFMQYRQYEYGRDLRTRYLYPLSNRSLYKAENEWKDPDYGSDFSSTVLSLLKIFDEVIAVNADNDFVWVIDGENRLYRINRIKSAIISPAIDVFVKRVSNEKGKLFSLSDIVLVPGENVLNFKIVAPGYLKQNTTQYQYIIDGLMSDWSPWSVNSDYSIIRPKPGEYTFRVRARDLWGNLGEPEAISFTIKAPLIRTTGFWLFSGLAIMVMISYVVQLRERQLQRKNRLLEEKVRERTAEIEAQKEEITASIAYASRIQMALLPAEEHFRNTFSDYFIFFRPRDIVSGDFYWIGEDDKHLYFTVADCTGHGVPGAFMSTLGISALNEIIGNNRTLKANEILNILREKTKESLHQTGKEGETADGMDMAFCKLHRNKRMLEYAGAYNPLLHYRGDRVTEYRGDRMPIGIYYGEKESFTNHEIRIKKGDVIYIFSDGFADQFGGPKGGKYKKFNLKNLLTSISHKSMHDQFRILEDEFEKWKGTEGQVDDVTIIGVRI